MHLNRRQFMTALAATSGALYLSNLVQAENATSSEGTYQNPILQGDYPDPTVLRVGDKYYMTHSANAYCPALLIWESDNLVDWRPLSCALTDYTGDIWAPDLAYHKGKFYIYFTASNFGNHVITADKIEGPWTKPVNLKLPGIDPGHIATPDGKRYLYLSDGWMIQLAEDGISTAGTLQKVFEPWPIPRDWDVECTCLESPKLFFHKGYYHLIVAEGGTAGPATSHMAVHARSKSPTGPWELSPLNPIIHTSSAQERWWSRGHATAVEAKDGSWWLIYHSVEKDYYNQGRCTLMEPLEWTPTGWLRVIPGTDPAGKIRRPPGEPKPYAVLHSDDFSSAPLNPLWRFYGEDGIDTWKCGDKVLRLTGRGITPANGRVLTRITGDKAYSVEVKVSVEPEARGGLILFYNNVCYLGLVVDAAGIDFHQLDKHTVASAEPVKETQITLRIISKFHKVTFSYKRPGGNWTEYAETIDVSGYNHNTYGGFGDLRMALFAGGKGEAFFRDLKYKAL